MGKDIRVKRPVDDALLFRCNTTGAYLENAIVYKSKAYISFLACLISTYVKACLLKSNAEKTAEETKQAIRDDIALNLIEGDAEDETVKALRAALSSRLSQWDSLLETFPIDSLLFDVDPSKPFSASYLKSAASFNPGASQSEEDKAKKPAAYLYVFDPSKAIPTRVDIAEKPVFIPSQIPRGVVNGGSMRVDQDGKSINVQVYFDSSSSSEVPRRYADYFENCPDYSAVSAKGVVYVQSATLLKMVVDDKIAAQRRKEQEEHEKKKEEAKAKKAEEKKRKLEEEGAKEKPLKGRKSAKTDSSSE